MASVLLWAITIATVVSLATNVSSATKAEECPNVCRCSATRAMCSGAALTRIPDNLPPSIRFLNVSHNALTNMDSLSLYHSLEEVDLDQNQITSLPTWFPTTMQHLEILHLRGNSIKELAASLVQLPRLRELYLSNNNIREVDVEITSGMEELRILDLSRNQIEIIPNDMLINSPHLDQLNLGYNSIHSLNSSAFSGLGSLSSLSLRRNKISRLNSTVFHSLAKLHSLDLSSNKLQALDAEIFAENSQLASLSLRSNHISVTSPSVLSKLSELSYLDLSDNGLVHVSGDFLRENSNLLYLNLSSNLLLDDIDPAAFHGLTSIKSIDLSHNPKLGHVHRDLFLPCVSLQVINVSYCGFQNLYQEAFLGLPKLLELSVEGNPLECNCAIKWIKNTSLVQNLTNVMCRPHDDVMNLTWSLDSVPTQDLNCTGAQITNHTHWRVFFKLGAPARLVCETTGVPSAAIIWTTPSGRVFVHNDPWVSNITHHHVDNESFHEDHHWHDNVQEYFHDVPNEHTHLLQDGSLYIDYVTRTHAGKYTCTARNIAGNDTTVIDLRLNYTRLYELQKMSFLIGASCSIGFLILSLSIRGIQLAAKRCCRKCRKSPPEERKGIRQILENLDAYRTEKMDRLREGYNTQMGKIRDIKDQCSLQVERMRDNYHSQIGRIKENCSQQMDKLRENYHSQLSRIKDYKSNKLIKIRENYGAQKAKIREYGVQQLKKLHENYKLQQQHLIKILETMNLDHCKGVIEAECVRTESMLFNADHLLDPSAIDTPDDLSESPSEYLTAVSTNFSERDLTELQEYDVEESEISISDYNSNVENEQEAGQDFVIEVDTNIKDNDHIVTINEEGSENNPGTFKESSV